MYYARGRLEEKHDVLFFWSMSFLEVLAVAKEWATKGLFVVIAGGSDAS